MNANKLFSEFSIKKIWDKLLQHDKAMNSTILVLSSGHWVEQEDGTFKNTVSYSTFKDTDKLTVDLYDDGTLTDTILTEYELYIDSFTVINGGLVAVANTKPTQTMTLVVKGEFEVDKVELTSIECVNDFESTETNVPASGNLVRLLKEELDGAISDLEEQVFQFGSDRKSEVIAALKDSGIELPEDISWNDIPIYLSSYKGILVSNLTEMYPTDTLNLTGGFTGALSHHNSQWASGYYESGSVSSINAIDFTNIKTLKISHYLNKYHDSGALPIYIQVGITDSSGAWIKSASRSFTASAKNSGTYTETFDTSELKGTYYITWSYTMYCRTQANVNSIYIQA